MTRSFRQGELKPASWDDALSLSAARFAQIINEHGPNSIGFYLSGQLLTEDYYVFNKLVKGLIGTNNLDTNSRLCMSSAVSGYKATLGMDAPPGCYEDIDHTDFLFITGSNTAWAHPIIFRRIEDAKASRPDLKIVVVDPRKTDTTEIADLHLQIKPGTDVMLYNGMLHIMHWEGWLKQDFINNHTEGFEHLKEVIKDCTPEHVAQICGVRREDIFQAAKWFACSQATLSLYCQGLNQSSHGTDNNTALINLHLATAQIGRPGASPLSLTGQPNAMGGREVGGLSNLLSAHRDMSNPSDRAQVAAFWGVQDVPAQAGKSAIEMFQAAADGEIKALWIACTNPAQSLPDQSTVRRALQRAEFVVLQEAFKTTATANYADVLLPASSWGEKLGTVTNSERCISRVRRAVASPGQAQPDWVIGVRFAKHLAPLLGHKRVLDMNSFMPYATDSLELGVEQIWNEHRQTTENRDLDITGLTYSKLEQEGPQQWPYPSGSSSGEKRLYTDGVFPTPSGRARFTAPKYLGVHETVDPKYPFALNTGRLRDHWHGMSRTGSVAKLFGHVSEPVVQMHPQDIARRLLVEGELVCVTSRRGSLVLPLEASSQVGLSQAYIPMHWGEEFLTGCSITGSKIGGVNALMPSVYCSVSKQPELKHAAVHIKSAKLPWNLFAMVSMNAGDSASSLKAKETLKDLMSIFAYSTCVPFGDSSSTPSEQSAQAHKVHGLLFRACALEAPPASIVQEIEKILGIDLTQALHYNDIRRGQSRTLQLGSSAQHTVLKGFVLIGETSAHTWLKELLVRQTPVQDLGRRLLVPGPNPPVAIGASSKVICNCLGVRDQEIRQSLVNCTGSPVERLAQLRDQLKCGTQCGSCLPELKRMVRESSS
jgi:assimilatory nitrate reductase catalytic subunit